MYVNMYHVEIRIMYVNMYHVSIEIDIDILHVYTYIIYMYTHIPQRLVT